MADNNKAPDKGATEKSPSKTDDKPAGAEPIVQRHTLAGQLPESGMGTPPPAPAPLPPYEGEDVTYFPGDGDPRIVKWRGQEFRAGETKRVKDLSHVDAARGNSHFRVGKDGAHGDNPNRGPSDSMQYRGHVLAWLNDAEIGVEKFIQKWSEEKRMREQCGVGEDDIRWLGTLLEPRLRQMRMREGMSDRQVADIWIKYGILDIPWRAS